MANPIPIAVICDLMGVPEADRHYMIELTDHLVEGTSAGDLDPQAYGNNRPLRELPFNSPAAFGLDAYARDTRQRCIDDPSNDLLSQLAIVEIDGERLSETEFRPVLPADDLCRERDNPFGNVTSRDPGGRSRRPVRTTCC